MKTQRAHYSMSVPMAGTWFSYGCFLLEGPRARTQVCPTTKNCTPCTTFYGNTRESALVSAVKTETREHCLRDHSNSSAL